MSLTKKYLKKRNACQVTFSLPKDAVENAIEVRLLGEFNDWNWKKGKIMKLKNGNFTTTMELPKDKSFQFRYALDNQSWENDWQADDYCATPYGADNSVVTT